jgi:hypothetical protein
LHHRAFFGAQLKRTCSDDELMNNHSAAIAPVFSCTCLHAGAVRCRRLSPSKYECFAALLSWGGYGEVSTADPKDRGFRTFVSLSTTIWSNFLALANTSVVHNDLHSALTLLISCLARVCRSRQARAAGGRVGEVFCKERARPGAVHLKGGRQCPSGFWCGLADGGACKARQPRGRARLVPAPRKRGECDCATVGPCTYWRPSILHPLPRWRLIPPSF